MRTLGVQRGQMFAFAVGLLALSAEGSPAAPAPLEQFVYIGTHGAPGPRPGVQPQAGNMPSAQVGPQGIYAAGLNSNTGQLSLIGITAELQRATWLTTHPSLPVIYSVAESAGGMEADSNIVSFKIDKVTGKLLPLNQVGAGGHDATIMDLDAASSTLIVGNHGSGSVTALPLFADGSLGPVASMQSEYGTGPSPRQKTPSAHGVAVDMSHKFVAVADFGADRIFVFQFDGNAKTLSPAETPFEGLPAGTGPRHLLFHPNGRFLILDTELTGELRSYGWDSGKGRLRPVQTLSPFPANYSGEKSGAEIAVSHDGRFVYLSLRGDEDKIVVYAFDGKRGTMREIQRVSARGKVPWSFGIDITGRWMLVANEGSDSVVELKINPATGRLTPTDQSLTIPKPVTVAFYGR